VKMWWTVCGGTPYHILNEEVVGYKRRKALPDFSRFNHYNSNMVYTGRTMSSTNNNGMAKPAQLFVKKKVTTIIYREQVNLKKGILDQ